MIEKGYAHDLMNRLVTESQKEMILRFNLKPLKAYLLVSLVQLATTHDDIPEHPLEFGLEFIKAFCDRYRDELPAMVESFELVNQENFLMTKDEFDDLTGDRIGTWVPVLGDYQDVDEIQGDIDTFTGEGGQRTHNDDYVDDFE